MHPLPHTSRPDRRPPVWTVVFAAALRPEAELVLGRLEAEGIPAVLLDRSPSAYPLMGEVCVLVDRDRLLEALHLLQTPAP
ncbi:MAG: DUF2007 domain-containing protein [Flavobacteriales bacterium]|nr:DUF2007 domain-containing protein [Flavobacteriales bacterium]